MVPAGDEGRWRRRQCKLKIRPAEDYIKDISMLSIFPEIEIGKDMPWNPGWIPIMKNFSGE